jgi:BirA family biotin operon repressor/biotin-[acetyl-CoA-carboxylase] ligase
VYNRNVNEQQLIDALTKFNIPALRYYPEVASTNDSALDWAEEGAAEFSLVVAETQTKGRGRMNRKWITMPEEGLAFSTVIRPRPDEKISLFSLLGGVAVCDSLIRFHHIPALIKWPNDILAHNKKVSGILADARWQGSNLNLVLGIGLNSGKGSIPPQTEFSFPATSLEEETGQPVNRIEILIGIVQCLLAWRNSIRAKELIKFVEDHLAFKHQMVQAILPGNYIYGTLEGIDKDGNLQILQDDGKTISVEMGDIQLRPFNDHALRERGNHVE